MRLASAVLALASLAACASSPPPTVVLLTDFGLTGDAPGLMRGAVLRIAPQGRVVDLTHGIAPFDVREAALVLRDAPASFPDGVVFCAVVDPGVGTARRVLAVRLENGTIVVAPDNGLVTALVAEHPDAEVREVADSGLFLPRTSETFHGRDVFAPTAAHLAAGHPFERVGPRVDDWVRLDLPAPRREDGALAGTVERIDRPFGNVWTDIPADWLPSPTACGRPARYRVHLGPRVLDVPLVRAFGEVERGHPLLYENSRGRLALALRERNLAATLGVRPGDPVRIEPLP